MAEICASDARVGPDALVWAAGRQPGGWKPSFARPGRRGVYPYTKFQAALIQTCRKSKFFRTLRRICH